MILFDLKCLDGGETFEGWFRSSSDFDEQSARDLVECPFCGSPRIAKAPMAPRVPRKVGSDRPDEPLARLAAIQSKLLQGSSWVGDRFAETARAMHDGKMERQAVHGEATLADARSLFEEGIPVLPLPLPVIPPSQVN